MNESAKKKKEAGKRLSEGILSRFFQTLRKTFAVHRPSEIDEEISLMRVEREKARRMIEKTRATLDGEDDWFRNSGERDDE